MVKAPPLTLSDIVHYMGGTSVVAQRSGKAVRTIEYWKAQGWVPRNKWGLMVKASVGTRVLLTEADLEALMPESERAAREAAARDLHPASEKQNGKESTKTKGHAPRPQKRVKGKEGRFR